MQQGIIEVVNPEVLVIFLCCWYEFVVWGRCSKPNYNLARCLLCHLEVSSSSWIVDQDAAIASSLGVQSMVHSVLCTIRNRERGALEYEVNMVGMCDYCYCVDCKSSSRSIVVNCCKEWYIVVKRNKTVLEVVKIVNVENTGKWRWRWQCRCDRRRCYGDDSAADGMAMAMPMLPMAR